MPLAPKRKIVPVRGADRGSEGSFRWVTGETYSYNNFGGGQPDNAGGQEHYVHFSGSWGWNDHLKNGWGSGFGYVCEYFDGQTDVEQDWTDPEITSVTYDYAANTLTFNGNLLNELGIYYFQLYNQTTGQWDYVYYWDCSTSDTQWVCNRYVSGGTWNVDFYQHSGNWNYGVTSFLSDAPPPQITSATYDYTTNTLVLNGLGLNDSSLFYYINLYNYNNGNGDYFYYWDCSTSSTQWVCYNRNLSGGTWEISYYTGWWSWNWTGITFTSDRPQPQITSASYDTANNILTVFGTSLNDSSIFYYFDLWNGNTGRYDYFYYWDCWFPDSSQMQCSRYLQGGTWYIRHNTSWWEWRDSGISFLSDRPTPQITSATYDYVNNQVTLNGNALNDSSVFYYFDLYNQSGRTVNFYYWDCPVYTDAQLVCNISLGGGTWRIRYYNWDWCWLDSGIDFINERPQPLITSTTFNSKTKTISINGQNLDQFLHLNVWNNSGFNSSWYSWDCGAVITATQVTCTLNITSPGRYYFYFYDNFWDQYYAEFDVFEWIAGPVLLLKMDGSDGSGSFVDSSPRVQMINSQGSAIQTTSQIRFGHASGFFNGSSWLTVADNAAFKWGSENFTIEGWFYPTANSSASVLWSHRNVTSGYGGALLYADSVGTLRYVVANSDATGWQTSGDPSTGLTWTLNQWQHIALVRNGDTLTGYLNGVAGTPITVTGEIGSSGDFAIMSGAAQENSGQFFTGYADEFKVTLAESLYTGNFNVPQLPMNSTTSLILHMDGAHDSAEFIDSSDYAFAVTTNGGAKQSTSVKKVGTASGVFNGSTDLMIPANIAFNFGPGDFTIEGWMRPSTVTDHMLLMCGGAPGALCFGFNSSGTRFGVARRNVGWDLNVRVAVEANQWVHVAVSRASGVMKLFLNGVLISTVNNSISYDVGSGDLYIGSHNGSHYFNGYLDSVRIAKKALYTASFAPPTTPHVTEDNFTGDGVFDEFCYQNFVTLGAVGGGTGWCAGNQTFYIGGIPYPGLNQSGTGTSGNYYFVNAQPANGYLIGKCWDNGLGTQGVVSGKGWCTGDSTYYVGGNATPLDKTGRGTYQGQFYINGFVANEVVMVDNTVLLLHFDGAENSEVFTDSARNRTATTRGSPKISTLESKFGGASAYFAGNGFVSYSSDSDFAFGTGDFTIEWWQYITAYREMSLVTTADPIDADGFLMHTTYQRAARLLGGNAEGSWRLDRWYWNWGESGNWRHYAVSRKNGVTKAFMNGSEVDSFNDSNNYTNINKLIRIGGRNIGSQYFEGYIDEVRVTKGKALYTTNFSVPTSAFSPQVVCYSNGYATTDIDSSGSGVCSSNNERYVNGTKANGIVDGYYYVAGFKASELVRDTKTLLLMRGEGTNNSALFEDSSVYLNHITKRGSPVISTAQSKFGSSSLFFPGGENYLRLPNVGGLGSGDFTLEMWVYPQEHGGSVAGGQLIGTTDGSTTGWSFNLGESKDRLRLISNVTGSWRDELVVNPGGGLDLNQWAHVALVRKGDKLSIFKNGTLVGSSTGFSGKVFPQRTVVIGRFHDGGTVRHFKGYIDEVRLTQGTALYDANFTPSTSSLAVKSICYENGLEVPNVINSKESGYCGVFYYVEGRKMIGLNSSGTGYAVGAETCRTFTDYTGDWGTPGGAWGTVSLKLPDTVALPALVRITDLGSDDGIGVNGERLTWYSTGTFDRSFTSREYTLSAWNGYGPSGYNAKICYTPSGCFVNGVPTHTINSAGNGTCNGITYVGGAPQ
ncbi:hypothetical protein EBR78_03500 [bacterium]|nr:hypothetical protein [bacterium]